MGFSFYVHKYNLPIMKYTLKNDPGDVTKFISAPTGRPQLLNLKKACVTVYKLVA